MSSILSSMGVWKSLVLCACLWVTLALSAVTRATETIDAIVVLGHRPPLEKQSVEYETRARVEHGVALWRARRAPVVLMTGGRSTPETIEADVMADYAISLGVPTSAILRERDSRDTIENARFSIPMLRRALNVATPRVLLVTSDYHSERAAALFRCAGATVVTSPVTLRLSSTSRLFQRMREGMVQVSYWFVDECALTRQP